MLDRLLSIWNSMQPADRTALAVGLLVGVAVLFAVRARQMWTHRRAYGYSVYDADQRRRLLSRWAWVAMGSVGLVGGLWLTTNLLIGPPANSPAGAVETPAVTTVPNVSLIIPRLAVETEVIEAPIVAQQWDVSRLTDQVAHLELTSYPGQPGNAVLAGHVTIPDAGWGPFRDLDKLEPGDRIFFESGEDVYIYEVSDKLLVAPTDVHVAYPTDDTRLTLITCAGWSDEVEEYTERVVVVAMLVP